MKSQAFYDKMLLDAIPNITRLDSLSGGEGTAYFFGDYVIKEYDENINKDLEFKRLFPLYCKELKKFSDMGFNVPKIYSWVVLDNPDLPMFYILEERIKDRPLFAPSLPYFYSIFKEKASQDHYDRIILNRVLYFKEFQSLIEDYLKDIIAMNEFLASMPENNLAKFLTDAYIMSTDAQYSIADLNSRNVFVNTSKNKISLIDNYFMDNSESTLPDRENRISVFTTSLLTLLLPSSPLECKHCIQSANRGILPTSIENLLKMNQKISKETVTRTIKILTKYCGKPNITRQEHWETIEDELFHSFEKDDAREILSLLDN